MSDKKSTSRFRNFATVLYPESAPSDWLSILREQIVPCFVSPLHDKDVNPDGEIKKAHYHILFVFEGKKSVEQVSEITSLIGSVGVEVVKSLRGYARYLCHLDNPEKFQYLPDDVISCSGLDYISTIGLVIDKYKAISDMMDFCDENNIISYRDLMLYCRQERFDWFRVLCDNGTYVIMEYLKSKAWSDSLQ